jgi:hypothetical protein
MGYPRANWGVMYVLSKGLPKDFIGTHLGTYLGFRTLASYLGGYVKHIKGLSKTYPRGYTKPT